MQSLRRGLRNSDTVSELQDRLRILPTELGKFFQHILDSVEKVYHSQAARIYLMCLTAKIPARGVLTTMTVSFFDEKRSDFALTRGSYSWDRGEIQRRAKDISKRILARCTDLIKISIDNKIEFLHRTVHDFLHLREVHDLLVQRAGPDFDAYQYMCSATLSQLLVPNTGYDYSLRTDRLMSLVFNFLDHAYGMEIYSTFTSCRLLDRLDREVDRPQEDDVRFGVPRLFEKHWLVPLAV